jgi:hypothetical protein
MWARTAYTRGMEDKKPLNLFQEVHAKVQERLDRAREAQSNDSVLRKKRSDEEAMREGFDRSPA